MNKQSMTHFSKKLMKLALLGLALPLSLVSVADTPALNQSEKAVYANDFGSGNRASDYLPVANAWRFDAYPDYYSILGASRLNPAVFPEPSKMSYSPLDELGRTQVARGTITYHNIVMNYNVRQRFAKNQNPSGWIGNPRNVRYTIEWLDGLFYQGDFWNRSHLIADSLGGAALRVNAITGTRTQNVGGRNQRGGMRYIEQKVQQWIEQHTSAVVYYEALPIYQANELVPRAVVVSALSSDGGLDEKVMVYNTANGYTINYATGAFQSN